MTEVLHEDVPTAGWRLKLGVALFGFSIALPVLGIPLFATMGLSTATMTTASGVMLMGAEVLGIAAVAIMGKSGYAYIKSRVFGFLKQYGPPAEVSRTRYTIGLLLFVIPIVFGWLAFYATDMIPGLRGNEFTYGITGDLMLLISLFVLGGDFWGKLQSLFIHDAYAVVPGEE